MSTSAIRLKIETLQPVLATSFAGDPNSDVSYPYLPGSLLRGALIGRYLRRSRQRELDLSNPLVQSLFFDERQSTYLNAYPVSQAGCRTLPTPRSWFKEKGTIVPLTAYDFSIEVDEGVESPKPLEKGFWGYDKEANINLYQPSKRINIHNARDRSKGRGTETEGEIFRYESIDVGELFESVIICPEDHVAEFEKLLTDQDFWLGGSQSAGYGHVCITHEVLKKPWKEAKKASHPEYEGLQITCLSDVILRDEMGQVTASPDVLRRAIVHKTGVDLTMHPERRSYLDHTTVGGFNRKWGLPLPQMPALSMGSVLVLAGKLTSEQIQQIETQGIGERLIDGFGRLAVNMWQDKRFDIHSPHAPYQEHPSIILTEKESTMAQTVAQRILHQRLERLLQRKASELSIQGGRISNSQLSRLWLTAREAMNKNDTSAITKLLENLPRNAKEQFCRARVGKQSLMDWITTNISQPGAWIVNPRNLDVTIADQKYDVSDAMKREYTLRLIMALAKNASKTETLV
jgi:CRISPR-associated protein Csx10